MKMNSEKSTMKVGVFVLLCTDIKAGVMTHKVAAIGAATAI